MGRHCEKGTYQVKLKPSPYKSEFLAECLMVKSLPETLLPFLFRSFTCGIEAYQRKGGIETKQDPAWPSQVQTLSCPSFLFVEKKALVSQAFITPQRADSSCHQLGK